MGRARPTTGRPAPGTSTAPGDGPRPVVEVQALPVDDAPPAAQGRALARVQRVASLLDTRWTIPGTRIGFGLDSLVGLLPVVGDVLPAGVSLWIVDEARRAGVPPAVLARMLGNVAVDVAVGAVPLLGDAFDLFWKANRRNARLMERALGRAAGDGSR